jgi:hypothetical protein
VYREGYLYQSQLPSNDVVRVGFIRLYGG